MKRLFPLTAVFCLFLLWGCPKEVKEDPVLTPNQIAYTVGADGGEVTISFKSNQECSVSSDASWLKVATKATKAVSTRNVTLSAQPNTSKDSRTANVTVKGGTLTITVTVTQEGKKDDTPTPPDPPAPEDPDVLQNVGASTYSIPYSGGNFVVKVRSNVNYTYEVGADWITQTKAKTTRDDNITFNVAANTGDARTATVTFNWGSELSFVVTVSQAAYVEIVDEPYMDLSTSDIFAEGEGGNYSIEVNANYEYEVVFGVSWISVVQKGETCVLHIDPNPGEYSRTTQVLFACEDIEKFITVNQVGMDANADPFDIGSNLSARGTANCYVVTKPGEYSFDATYMGNGPDGFIWEDEAAVAQFLWPWKKADVSFIDYGNDGPSQVSVLWDDGGVLTDVSIDNLKVSFTATGKKGSALIAVYDRSNVLLCSWHIWCTDSPKRVRHETLNGTSIELLDRNLGATSVNPADGAATYGYWYQFGRKDPLKLYNGVAWSMYVGQQSMEHSVLHPTLIYKIYGKDTEWFNGSVETITADLWGNPYALHNGADHLYPATMSELRKTIYDPCPPGYMVPPEWTWDSFNMDNCMVSEYGLTFSGPNGDSFYPFAGFGDSGDAYGGDSGWYGYPGYTPNIDPSTGLYHHNCRNVVACWSSGSAYHYDAQYNAVNYHHVNMFFYRQDEEASQNKVMVNENSQAHLDTKYSHIRERCCSVRCMKIQ